MARISVVVMVAVAVVAAVVAAAPWQGSGASQAARSGPPRAPRVAGPPELARFLRAFPVARGASPAPPALVAHIAATSGAVDRSQLRWAVRVAAAEPLWIVYGGRVVCLVQASSGAFSCETTQRALTLGISLGTVDLGPAPRRRVRGFRLLGLAPARARTVVLGVRGRPLRRVQPRAGVFALRARRPLRVLRYER